MLCRQHPLAHFVAVNFWHVDISQHHFEETSTALRLKSMLEALNCICSIVKFDAANIFFTQELIEKYQVKLVVVYQHDVDRTHIVTLLLA